MGCIFPPNINQPEVIFFYVVIEAESNEFVGCTCNICSHLVLHLHAHKVILQSGCDYLQVLLRLGMQESHSQVIKQYVELCWLGNYGILVNLKSLMRH